MRIRFADGSSMRAEDYYDRAVDQWLEQTPSAEQDVKSFWLFMKLAGFDWGREWIIDQWDDLQKGLALEAEEKEKELNDG